MILIAIYIHIYIRSLLVFLLSQMVSRYVIFQESSFLTQEFLLEIIPSAQITLVFYNGLHNIP